MSFLYPWWLLAGLLAGAVVVLLHRLRPRRRTVQVSSLLLWREVERRLAAGRRRRRLLTSLLLLAQIAALGVLAVALAGPVRSLATPPVHVAVLVDTSSSMAAPGGDGGSRYEEAVRALRRALATGEAERYTLIATTGDPLRYDGPEKRALLESLDRLPPPLGPSDWEAALRTLRALRRSDRPLALLVAGDGAWEPQRVAALGALGPDAHIYFIDVGSEVANVAVTEFSARPVSSSTGQHQVLVRVRNESGEPRAVTLRVTSLAEAEQAADGPVREVLSRELSLPPRSGETVLFTHTFRPREALAARLEGVTDGLAVDDAAYLAAGSGRPVRVLHVGRASALVEQSMAALGYVDLDDTLLLDPPPTLTRAYDLVLFYDVPVPPGFQGTALQLVSGRTEGEEDAPLAEWPELTWWNQAHPLARFVAWEGVRVGPMRALSPLPGEHVLVDSSAGPAVTVEEQGARRVVRVAIPLERSDFPFRVAYPVFLQNVIHWAGGAEARGVPAPLSLGRLPAQALAALAALEEGQALSLTPLTWPGASPAPATSIRAAGADPLPALAAPGVYAWRAGGREALFAVSLLDGEESNLSPRGWEALPAGALELGGRDLAALLAELDAGRRDPVRAAAGTEPLRRTAALIALALLAGESLLYFRRYQAERSAAPAYFHVGDRPHAPAPAAGSPDHPGSAEGAAP